MENVEELEKKFSEKQQDLIDSFKGKLEKACSSVLGDMYSDVLNYATTDAHINYHNFLRDEFRASMIKEISEQHSHYSWAHSIRTELLKQHPEILRNKSISDLEEKVKSLESHIDQLRERWR